MFTFLKYFLGVLIIGILSLSVHFVVFKPKNDLIKPLIANEMDEGDIKTLLIDARIARIDNYFAKRKMPLSGYGKKFIEVSDKYNLDWRLLPAISIRESSGGKQMCGNNPFGWASCRRDFESIEEGIETVAWNLAGQNPNTAPYYAGKDIYGILWSYNGTVNAKYPDEVIEIMNGF